MCPIEKLNTQAIPPQRKNLALKNQISAECALCKSYAKVDSSNPISISETIPHPHSLKLVKNVGLNALSFCATVCMNGVCISP